MYLENFNRGMVRSYWYELLDQGTNGSQEATFGFVDNKFDYKPQGAAIRNLTTLLKDATFNTETRKWVSPDAAFVPQSLDYSLTGATENVHSTLLQKTDGKFYLCLWQEVSSYNIDNAVEADIDNPDVKVTLNLKTPISAATSYLPTSGVSSTKLDVAQGQIKLSVPDQVLIVDSLRRQPKLQRKGVDGCEHPPIFAFHKILGKPPRLIGWHRPIKSHLSTLERSMKFTSLSLLLALAAPSIAAPATTALPRYNWQNVTIGGGGYVTGVLSHPTKDATFLRTDVGGFYRRDGEKWQAISDGFQASQSNYYGGEAFAFDPKNPAVVYIAGGKYTAQWAGKGALFRSADMGKTWKKLALELPMGGNQDRRWGGERLAVDPFDSKHLIFGSRAGELWQSRDTGATWARVALPQTGKADVGLLSLVFSAQKRGLIFANSFGAGISTSLDGGATWKVLEGAPTNALRLAPIMGGLLATAEGAEATENRARGGVWKWDGATWSDITPPVDSSNAKNGFCALAVHPTDEKTLVTATNQLESTLFSLSKDGGITWKTLKNQPQNSVPWQKTTLGKKAFASHVAALAFDGASDSVLFTDWYGVWKSAPLGDGNAPIEWKNEARGIEQIVAFDLLSAPGGAPLLSGLADVDGFLHADLAQPPAAAYSKSGPWFQHTFDLAFCAQKPGNLARVGGNAWSNTYWGASSDDGGKTWREFGPKRDQPILRVAIGADDPLNLVILNSKSPALFSRDGGTTWAECLGLPNGPEGPWFWGQPLAADAVRAGVFYVAQGGSFYRSEDGGANFQNLGDLPDDYRGGLQVRPKVAGELWQSAGDKGLFRSQDGGKNWQEIAGVESASLLAVGEVKGQFAVFFVGKVYGEYGLYRSLDEGKNWQKIENGTGFLPGDEPNSLTLSGNGDGAVFVGTNGRGVFVGKPTP